MWVPIMVNMMKIAHVHPHTVAPVLLIQLVLLNRHNLVHFSLVQHHLLVNIIGVAVPTIVSLVQPGEQFLVQSHAPTRVTNTHFGQQCAVQGRPSKSEPLALRQNQLAVSLLPHSILFQLSLSHEQELLIAHPLVRPTSGVGTASMAV
jgi:hypothetical protein